MSLWIVGLANAAAARASDGQASWSLGPATFAEWIMLFLAALSVGAAFGLLRVLGAIRDRLPRSPVPDAQEFARTLRADIKEYTEATTDVLLDKLQTHPNNIETLRTQLRSLRNELSDALEYIDRMKLIAPGYFPSPAISSAYGRWAGDVRALHRQIEDLHLEMTFPLVHEPVVRQRETYLVGQYLVEKEVMVRQLDRIKAAAARLDGLVAKAIKKDSVKADDHGDADGQH